MTHSGKGKEKEIVGEPSTTTPSAHALTIESGTFDTAPTFAVTTSPPKEVSGASTDPVEAPSTDQTELPSETTEGPSISAQQINPHVTVVSLHISILPLRAPPTISTSRYFKITMNRA
jgi:hypothetical protein